LFAAVLTVCTNLHIFIADEYSQVFSRRANTLTMLYIKLKTLLQIPDQHSYDKVALLLINI